MNPNGESTHCHHPHVSHAVLVEFWSNGTVTVPQRTLRAIAACTQDFNVYDGDTHNSVSIAFCLRPEILVHMNPKIGEHCTSLEVGEQHCVQSVISDNPGRAFN